MANQGQFTTGAVLTAAELNAFVPLTCLSKVAAQSIPTSARTDITFTTEDIDVLDWHSNVTNTERITPTIAGWYNVTVIGTYDASLAARIIFGINRSGSQYAKYDVIGNTSANGATVSANMYLNGTTDYVTFETYQFSGSNQNFGGSGVGLKLQVALLRNV